MSDRAAAVLTGFILVCAPGAPRAFPLQQPDDLVQTANAAVRDAKKGGDEITARKAQQQKAQEESKKAEAEKAEPPCAAQVWNYGQASKQLSDVTPSRFGGDHDLYSAAKDATLKDHESARDRLVQCALDTVKRKNLCARELKTLGKAEAAYNDPRLVDTGGELQRKRTAALENLSLCFSSNDIDLPKGFVEQNRDRWTQSPGE